MTAPSTTFVKICGLNDGAAVETAIAAGADAVGFVMFVPASPRNIEPSDFITFSDLVRGRAKTVIVTADIGLARLGDVLRGLEPDVIQLHGSETPDDVRRLRTDLAPGQEIWKAISVSTRGDLDKAADYDAADRLLLDAKPPKGASRTGGFGVAFDWTLLAGWTVPKPWILSGGLTLSNVVDAIRVTEATAVDVSSGVESAPGVKDLAMIATFVATAKATHPKTVSGVA